MITRKEICDSYNVNDYGTIQSPGKFEGEPLYLVWAYDVYMNGCSNEVYPECDCGEGECFCRPTSVVTVDDETRKEFPELEDKTAVAFIETDSGFVCECDVPEDSE